MALPGPRVQPEAGARLTFGDPYEGLPDRARPGCRIAGRYLVEGALGRGGMGAVLRAADPDGRPVAVKLMLQLTVSGQRRFAREARLGAELEHPHLVRVLDRGVEEGIPFLVMELLEGTTLEARLREAGGPLPPDEAEAIATALAGALGYLHAHDLVHRDLKPENVHLGPDGEVKLMDLGLVRDPTVTALTRTGAALGTPTYMAPEQLEGKAVGPEADVFALGLVLHRMVRGDHPYRQPGELFDLAKHVQRVLGSAGAPTRADGLDHVFDRALARRVEDRYPTPRDLVDAVFRGDEDAPTVDLSGAAGDPLGAVPPPGDAFATLPSLGDVAPAESPPPRRTAGTAGRAMIGLALVLALAGLLPEVLRPVPEVRWWTLARLGPDTRVALLQLGAPAELPGSVAARGRPEIRLAPVPEAALALEVRDARGREVLRADLAGARVRPLAWLPPFGGGDLVVGLADPPMDLAFPRAHLPGNLARTSPERHLGWLLDLVARLDVEARVRSSWRSRAEVEALRRRLVEDGVPDALYALAPYLPEAVARERPGIFAALSKLRVLESFLLRRGVEAPYDLEALGIEELVFRADFYDVRPAAATGRYVFAQHQDHFSLDTPQPPAMLEPGGFFRREFPGVDLEGIEVGEGEEVWLEAFWTRHNLDGSFYFVAFRVNERGPFFVFENARAHPEEDWVKATPTDTFYRRRYRVRVPRSALGPTNRVEALFLPWQHPTGRTSDRVVMQAVGLVAHAP